MEKVMFLAMVLLAVCAVNCGAASLRSAAGNSSDEISANSSKTAETKNGTDIPFVVESKNATEESSNATKSASEMMGKEEDSPVGVAL
ncbi:unnamed protein product [Notodromas monacha]|uniref:Uncharacterized protein n=1 Tax=Notodromas monacha TaxID=399045 RepID=A0A7R9GL22_9CRUS|nr:unnamed protein product [Notodromas monacha]CAG0925242.1 unnamed protein product [Notodromas monacha]